MCMNCNFYEERRRDQRVVFVDHFSFLEGRYIISRFNVIFPATTTSLSQLTRIYIYSINDDDILEKFVKVRQRARDERFVQLSGN